MKIMNCKKKKVFIFVIMLLFSVVFANANEKANKKYRLSKAEKTYIWETLSDNYAGFDEMEEQGFTEKKFFKIKTYADLTKLFDQYISDCHFYFRYKDLEYRQPFARDEGTTESLDPAGQTYFEKETSNAYYVRFNSCTSQEYTNNLPQVYQKALEKEYLILDARSNYGGSDGPQLALIGGLYAWKYSGTIVVLQDNWSYSAGELWRIFAWQDEYPWKSILVGTHSGGCQVYGNCETYKNEDLQILLYFGVDAFWRILPSNYLGEGKGFEPQIWATTQTMKDVLEGLGIDTEGIEFR